MELNSRGNLIISGGMRFGRRVAYLFERGCNRYGERAFGAAQLVLFTPYVNTSKVIKDKYCFQRGGAAAKHIREVRYKLPLLIGS